MDIRTLTYFVAVAEELNITKAAEKLCISQPPLSSQMKNLEQELNTVLFIRGKRNLQLTDSGQLLYRRAKEIINLTDKAAREIISMKYGMIGIISMGLVEGIAPFIAASWLAGFMQEHPKVKFRILDGNTDDLVEKLRSGLVSLAVITAPYDQLLLNGFAVGSDKMVALINKNHPLANILENTLNIEDLKGQPLIVPRRKATIEQIYRWFRTINSEPNIVCEIDSCLDAVAFTEKNVGISIFPRAAYVDNNSLVYKNLNVDSCTTDYFFVWRKGHPLQVEEETFIDYLKENYTKK